MIKKILCIGVLLACVQAQAGDESNNVFVKALKDGEASTPLPNEPRFAPMKKALQDKTGDAGEIFIKARRVVRFTQQSKCGRIVFAITQPSKNIAWVDLGGQLNICEDGTPPWRVCADKPASLVPPNGTCADKSEPQDTPEVKAAIDKALANGGLTKDQARQASKQNEMQDRK